MSIRKFHFPLLALASVFAAAGCEDPSGQNQTGGNSSNDWAPTEAVTEIYNYSNAVNPSRYYYVEVNGQNSLVIPCIDTPAEGQPEFEHNICTFGCDGEVLVEVNSYSEAITEAQVLPKSRNYEYNLAVVFTSSIQGAAFQGAVGSVLYVDEVEVEGSNEACSKACSKRSSSLGPPTISRACSAKLSVGTNWIESGSRRHTPASTRTRLCKCLLSGAKANGEEASAINDGSLTNFTHETDFVCPLNVRTTWRDSVSHTSTRPSNEALTILVPSLLTATDVTGRV